jgi:RNA polymerase sigma-54 factor
MALHLQQLQKQTQRLIMTPQMQQSIQLLQLNSIEVEQLAEQELLENPFLMIDEEQPENPDRENDLESPGQADDSSAEALETAGAKDAESDSLQETTGDSNFDVISGDSIPEPVTDLDSSAATGDADSPESASIETEPEHFNEVDLNWDDYYSDSENKTYLGGRGENEERDFSEYVAARTSLYDHLNWQLRCCVLDGIDAEVGEYLIGSLDDNGFLSEDVIVEAAAQFNIGIEKIEAVLGIIQEFDPPGVAARNLTECLLIQMRLNETYTDLARQVLVEYFKEFQKKKFRDIARGLDVDEAKIQDVFRKVCRLEPHPGRSLTRDSVHYINPDVFVKVIDGEVMIYLNEGQAGRLSVDRFYQRMLRQQQQALDRKDKEYAVDRFRSALTLIKNIEKRKSTILRVTEAIMDVQRDFLDKGVETLKPLTLREIAEVVGMHESTVARVTSRKHVETPQGTYPLKFFFSSSIESSGSEAVSSRAIKDKLHQIIDAEDLKKPLSDQKIVVMLNDQGYNIARRTVAKYREQLKILPAKYRRET